MKAMHNLAALLVFAAFCLTPSAFAQGSARLQASGERPTEQQAIAFLDSFFSRHPRIVDNGCGILASDGPVKSHEISLSGVRLNYCGKHVRELTFAKLPVIRNCFDLGCRINYGGGLCVGAVEPPSWPDGYWCSGGSTFLDVPDKQGFANAWLALAHPLPREPAKDEAFLAALRAAASAGDRTEANRRAQVQVEALVGAGKTKEAAALYRNALATSPDWPSGHYNLALIAGDLGDLTEAITEMRRYLYLEPSAPDARAAQDQIYKWEALLSASPQQ